MKSSMALGVPSWKSSSLACRVTVYLEVDFILNWKVGKRQSSCDSWAEPTWWAAGKAHPADKSEP